MWGEFLQDGTKRKEGEFNLYDYCKKYLEKGYHGRSLHILTTAKDLLLCWAIWQETWSKVLLGLDGIPSLFRNSLKANYFTDPCWPSFVFQMHIPKNGGQTFTSSIHSFLEKRLSSRSTSSCSCNLYFTSLDSYNHNIKSNNFLNGDQLHSFWFFSHEIMASSILAMRQNTLGLNSENTSDHNTWWYTACM